MLFQSKVPPHPINVLFQWALLLRIESSPGKSQGVKVKTIQKNPSKREKTIPRAVAKLMREFPLEK